MVSLHWAFLVALIVAAVHAAPPPQGRWAWFCRFRPRHPRCQGGGGPGSGGALDIGLGPINLGLVNLPALSVPISIGPILDPLLNVPAGLRALVPQLLNLSPLAKQALLSVCATIGGCKTQPAEAIAKRTNILQQEAQRLSAIDPNAQATLEQQFDMTHQVKQAILFDEGLANDVEAVNDGTFEGDTLLTIPQAAAMLQTKAQRRKRYALYFEAPENAIKKWDITSPIPYILDNKLLDTEKASIRQGLQDIMDKTCLRFEESTTLPTKQNIFYQKTNGAGYCGLSYVGVTDPQNVIYLNFGSPKGCGNMLGVAAHETMHALGVTHQQVRRDRDQFITINWSNVNPQNYDFFAIPDGVGNKTFTEYGVPYDYSSVMHYAFNAAAVDITKATMTPKINPDFNSKILGQREGISDRDAQLLRKMYCMPDCVDKNIWCGYWALENRCLNGTYVGFMTDNCQKSCDLCPGQANAVASG